MSILSVDPDVQANLVVRQNAAGLRSEPYEIAAVSRFVRRAKALAYWDKLVELHAFNGRLKQATLYKIKWHASSTNLLTWIGGAGVADGRFSPRTSITADGTHALSTSYQPAQHLGAAVAAGTSWMFAVGFVWQSKASTNVAGSWDGGNGIFNMVIDGTNWNGSSPFEAGSGGGAVAHGATNAGGFYAINRVASNSVFLYRNAVQVGTNTTDIIATAITNEPVYILGRNVNGTNQPQVANDRPTFYAIGSGFTATDIANLHTDYVVLMQDLRRTI